MKQCFWVTIIFFFLIIFSAGLPAQEDIEGSSDHPLLSRMNNFYISDYEVSSYDSHAFYDAEDNEYIIEGKKWIIEYSLKEGFEPPGQLKVRKNYINAVKEIGGTILFERGVCMKVAHDDKETWIDLWVSSDGSDYRLTLVERKVMEQEVTADPNAMTEDLRFTGRTIIYGIYFDFDSAKVKRESEPTFRAIAEVLNSDISLKVYVVGHTDMTGSLDYNLSLSSQRAEAVVEKLVNEYGIVPDRMEARGVGPLCPVSTNLTEDGRRLNRRVELVQKIRSEKQ
jgi:OmpA-OmpF porin, OOP family